LNPQLTQPLLRRPASPKRVRKGEIPMQTTSLTVPSPARASVTWGRPVASVTWGRPVASVTWGRPVASVTWGRGPRSAI
jgi:hypothetical protein